MAPVIFQFLLESLLLEGAFQAGQNHVQLKRFYEIIVSALPHGVDSDADIIHAGSDQKNQFGIFALYLSEKLEPGESGHAQIRNHRAEPSTWQNVEGRLSVARAFVRNSRLRQHHSQHFSNSWFVVDDQDAVCCGFHSVGFRVVSKSTFEFVAWIRLESARTPSRFSIFCVNRSTSSDSRRM